MADREKKGEDENTKNWISQEGKEPFRWNFFDDIFHNYLRAKKWFDQKKKKKKNGGHKH